MKKIIEKEKCRYKIAKNGQEAVEYFLNEYFDLIFMDGLEATTHIRRIEKERDLSPIPIIGLSGNAAEKHKQHAISVGMTDYLTKPCMQVDIAKMISEWANVRQSLLSWPIIQGTNNDSESGDLKKPAYPLQWFIKDTNVGTSEKRSVTKDVPDTADSMAKGHE